MKEIDRWLELYETHDKYTFVGWLVDDPVNEVLDKIEKEDEVASEGGDTADPADEKNDEAEPVAEPGEA